MRASEYKPQLATLVREPPAGDEWLHEIKYDGYRIGCRIRDGRVVDRYVTLVNAGVRIPAFITGLTGISNDMVAAAPPVSAVSPARPRWSTMSPKKSGGVAR